MFISLDQILNLLSFYKYLLIFPLAVIEGPIVTILSGFLVSINELGFIPAYLILIAGDLTGDCLYYFMGYYSHRLPAGLLKFFGLTKGRILLFEYHFRNSPKTLFSIGKASHGIGSAILFASGLSRYPFKKFLLYNFGLTVIKTIILMLVGFYFGRAYQSLNKYLDYGALALGLASIAAYFIFLRSTKFTAKYENLNRHG